MRRRFNRGKKNFNDFEVIVSIISGNPGLPTASQVPDHSLLDINGRQTYLGNTFILPGNPNGVTLSDMTETNIALITNPATSKKSLFLFQRKLASTDTVIVRFYLNPTVSNHGTPATPINLRFANTNTSSSLVYNTPTTSAKGTFIAVLASIIEFETVSDVLFVLDPGQSMLVTAQTTSSDPVLVFQENIWYEI